MSREYPPSLAEALRFAIVGFVVIGFVLGAAVMFLVTRLLA